MSTELWLMRMIAWWNWMFTSEYSSSLACSRPSSKVANMARKSAISSSLARLVISRAAMLSSAARDRADEPFALELGHGLAHRGAADAEVLRELALIEPHVTRLVVDVERYDHVAQRRIGAVGEGRRVVERGDGDAGGRCAHVAAGGTHAEPNTDWRSG